MTMQEALAVLGINRTKWECQNMRLALSFCAFRNTVEEAQRLRATCYVLARWPAYQAACNAARDKKRGALARHIEREQGTE